MALIWAVNCSSVVFFRSKAPLGQLGTHAPHPMHETESMRTSVLPLLMALDGQLPMHMSQRSHLFGIKKATSGDTEISPLPRKVATLEAVAMDSIVVSRMSFGPCAVPAT